MSEMVDLSDEDLEWIKREEIEVEEEKSVNSPEAVCSPSTLHMKEATQWHTPHLAPATTTDDPEEKKRQRVAAGDHRMLISDAISITPLEEDPLSVSVPRSRRRRPLHQTPVDEQVVRVKIEAPAEEDRDRGSSTSASSQKSAASKRMRRGRARVEGVKVKMEPMEPDETMASGSSAELGAIRQLLSTLQKPVDDDQVFGEHVASELRSIRCLSVKKRLRRTIMMAIIDALEEDSYD